MGLRNIIPLRHRGQSLFVLLREFAKDESGKFNGFRAKALLSCDGETIEADVLVSEAGLGNMPPPRRPGVYIDGFDEDPWESFSEAELRAIRTRDAIYRAERQVHQTKRSA